ncbi:GNAT family N-acetyltransferase [Aeromicrobium sp. UC242_57]|uniref:GNAT family N-acetyltransferase n=1 Tax=Aeromicrobium sp. UC242_57 TaxID=3374624 RepID=UPI003787ED37
MTTRLLRLPPAVFTSLAAEDPATAERVLGLPVPAEFAGTTDIWRFMDALVTADTQNADWAMQAVLEDGVIVGNAGFKGAPAGGTVELGYRISSQYRRRGLAVSAVALLLDEARRDARVDLVIARISPDNFASIGVITRSGFNRLEDHQHPRWGRQVQFGYPLAPVTD